MNQICYRIEKEKIGDEEWKGKGGGGGVTETQNPDLINRIAC